MARILVAEDDAAVRQFVTRALGHAGHDVTAVSDGLAALAALEDSAFDLLLSDIAMPGMDGITLALKMSKERPEMAIVLTTGYAHERQRAHNLEALSHHVIDKPFTLSEIVEAVGTVLAARPPSAEPS